MAVIDIDRHILTEIVSANNDLKKNYREYKKYWAKIVEARDKIDALLFQTEENNKAREEVKKLRNELFRVTRKCECIMLCMQENYSKQAALLKHVVSEVRDFNTGKGTESYVPDVQE
jgi:hypothetical protein